MSSPFLRKQELKNRELTPGNEKVNLILYVLLNTQCLQLPGSQSSAGTAWDSSLQPSHSSQRSPLCLSRDSEANSSFPLVNLFLFSICSYSSSCFNFQELKLSQPCPSAIPLTCPLGLGQGQGILKKSWPVASLSLARMSNHDQDTTSLSLSPD